MTTLPQKTPIAWAASELARICDDMDKADRIDAFLDLFEDASLSLSEGVDRRIAVDREFKLKLASLQEGYRLYRALAEQCEAIHSRFRERTKRVLEDSPEGIREAFRGKLGRISLCDSAPSVEYSFGSKELTPEVAVMMGVDPSYIIAKMTYTVDSARVKAELLSGVELEWASLKRGTHIRFPNTPKKEIEG